MIDVRNYNAADLHSVYLKIKADIANTRCEMNKYEWMAEPSQNNTDKLKGLHKKLDALLKDEETVFKVENRDHVSYDDVVPKNTSISPKITTNAQSKIW